MSTHEIPLDGFTHVHVIGCPCRPQPRRRRRADGFLMTYYVHQDQSDDEESESDCGHTIVDVDGEPQHHQIPDDGIPHAPTSECGCGPQRITAGGHIVYMHADPDGDADADLWHSLDEDGGVR